MIEEGLRLEMRRTLLLPGMGGEKRLPSRSRGMEDTNSQEARPKESSDRERMERFI